LGYTLPVDVFTFGTPNSNSFVVVGGMIDISLSSLEILGGTGTGFSLRGPSFGTFLNVPNSFDVVSGVLDTDSSTLTFTPASATTPEPSILLGLLAVGSMGALARKRKA
jgi:hypothetical protein